MVQQDRYCRSCGQELRPEDQFCANCGSPVHATAHVPTPEADVPVPPPPQQAQGSSAPPQAPQPQSSVQQGRRTPRGPLLGMLGVFLFIGFLGIVQGMLTTGSGRPPGFVFGVGLGSALAMALPIAVLLLVLAGVYYLATQKNGTTFREALFNWPMVCVAAFVLVIYLAA
jgi:hypothetical protein